MRPAATIVYVDGSHKPLHTTTTVLLMDGTRVQVHAKCKALLVEKVLTDVFAPPTLVSNFSHMNIEDIIPFVLKTYEELNVRQHFADPQLEDFKPGPSLLTNLIAPIIAVYFQQGVSPLTATLQAFQHTMSGIGNAEPVVLNCVNYESLAGDLVVTKNPTPERQKLFKNFRKQLKACIVAKTFGVFNPTT